MQIDYSKGIAEADNAKRLLPETELPIIAKGIGHPCNARMPMIF